MRMCLLVYRILTHMPTKSDAHSCHSTQMHYACMSRLILIMLNFVLGCLEFSGVIWHAAKIGFCVLGCLDFSGVIGHAVFARVCVCVCVCVGLRVLLFVSA